MLNRALIEQRLTMITGCLAELEKMALLSKTEFLGKPGLSNSPWNTEGLPEGLRKKG